jgi:hypothetical protein
VSFVAPAALPPTGSARIARGRLEALAARVTAVAPREPMEVEKPFTGETLGWVPRCEEEDVERAVAGARAAQARWATTPLPERSAVLLRFHDLVLARQDEVLDLLQLEWARRAATPRRRWWTSRSWRATTPTPPRATCVRGGAGARCRC